MRDMRLEKTVDLVVEFIWKKLHRLEDLPVTKDSTTYWDGQGRYDAAYHQLFTELVPASGEASTLDGKALRRISKAYYRHYNDGDSVHDALYIDLSEYMRGTLTEFSREYYSYLPCEECGEDHGDLAYCPNSCEYCGTYGCEGECMEKEEEND